MISSNIVTIILILILNISLIQTQEQPLNGSEKIYIFGDFDDFKCNSTTYISSFTANLCTNQIISSDKSFSFSFEDTNSQSHKVKCLIDFKSKIRNLQQNYDSDIESIDSDLPIPEEKYCFNALCEFEGMVKEEFNFILDEKFQFVLEDFFDDTYIGIYWIEKSTFTVEKCYLVKNNFKQVSKYKVNTSTKKINFLFISSIISKVEKDETIYVDGQLIKNKNLEKVNITCTSKYTAELVQNEDILGFYDCEISNINNPDGYEGLLFNYSPDIQNIPNDDDLKNPSKVDEMIKNNNINDLSIILFNSENLELDKCGQNGTFQIKGKIKGKIDAINKFDISILLNNTENTTVQC